LNSLPQPTLLPPAAAAAQPKKSTGKGKEKKVARKAVRSTAPRCRLAQVT
jgi:hypothetical protein